MGYYDSTKIGYIGKKEACKRKKLKLKQECKTIIKGGIALVFILLWNKQTDVHLKYLAT